MPRTTLRRPPTALAVLLALLGTSLRNFALPGADISARRGSSAAKLLARGSGTTAKRAVARPPTCRSVASPRRRWWLGVGAALGVVLAGRPVRALEALYCLNTRAAATFAGFWPALATIIVSEIGDKTFFVAMLLSLRVGRAKALTASLAALAAMTLVSTGLGVAVQTFPQQLQVSEAFVHTISAGFFAFFGVSNLLQAKSATAAAADEKEEAREAVKQTLRGKAKETLTWKAWWQCALLVFLAEWADRSMLATIALAATWNPVGIVLGALMGHAAATALAVFGGNVLQEYITDTTAKIVGGVLFLVFAVTTLIGVY